MKYLVRYLGQGSSQVLDELVDAADPRAARAALELRAAVVVSVREQAQLRPEFRLDTAWWCRELGTLLRAGMTVVEAIETLAASRHDVARHGLHAKLLQTLKQGQSLSGAMRQVGVFPAVLVASVTASERTSTLADALGDYLRYDEMLDGLRRKLVSAAIYPAVVIALGLLITLFLLVFVIPRFSTMYTSSPRALSSATQAVLWLSGLMREQLPWVLLSLLLVVVALGWSIRQGHAALLLSRVIDGVAPLRAQWDHFRLAKLYQSLALMYRGGYTLDEALQVGHDLALGPRLAQGVQRAREEIARGRSAAQAFEAATLTEEVGLRLMAVGERAGKFDTVLQTIADRHAQAFATFIERSTRIVEPVLMLLVALLVGGVVVMMYMPIFDMANGLGAAP
jgi:general secretion pathway protein F